MSDPTIDSISQHYLEDATANFRKLKKLAERALAQTDDQAFFAVPDAASNSIAIIVKHMSGNLRSRFTDLLTTDGEKPWRHRDSEFIIEPGTTREALLRQWEEGWQCLFAALEPLQPADLDRKVFIRGEEHSVVQAINRQLTHHAYHVGQIVFLAKHYRSTNWRSLSIPRGKSEEFIESLRKRRESEESR
jgi:hypothetical protein